MRVDEEKKNQNQQPANHQTLTLFPVTRQPPLNMKPGHHSEKRFKSPGWQRVVQTVLPKSVHMSRCLGEQNANICPARNTHPPYPPPVTPQLGTDPPSMPAAHGQTQRTAWTPHHSNQLHTGLGVTHRTRHSPVSVTQTQPGTHSMGSKHNRLGVSWMS